LIFLEIIYQYYLKKKILLCWNTIFFPSKCQNNNDKVINYFLQNNIIYIYYIFIKIKTSENKKLENIIYKNNKIIFEDIPNNTENIIYYYINI
jgi:hypothetical protein